MLRDDPVESNGISLLPVPVLSLVVAGGAFRIAFTFMRIGVMDVVTRYLPQKEIKRK
jgi:hypothetical protein